MSFWYIDKMVSWKKPVDKITLAYLRDNKYHLTSDSLLTINVFYLMISIRIIKKNTLAYILYVD
jgi:hypothetical protein